MLNKKITVIENEAAAEAQKKRMKSRTNGYNKTRTTKSGNKPVL
jgi:hypothetical protein